jgi:hypothetical protein
MSISKTKIKTFALILAAAAVASAQFSSPGNARIDAMGGARTADISDVFRYPALMMGYNEHLQATFGAYPADGGGVIGVKSISEAFSIGILANQGRIADGMGIPFPNTPSDLAAGVLGGAAGAGGFNVTDYSFPHLLLGFDIASFKLGVDVFFEYANYDADRDDNGTKSFARGTIMNPGARLSVAAGAGEADVLIKFGMGLPSFSGEYQLPGGNTEKLGSDKGMYMEMGAEATAPIIGLDWTLGGAYIISNFQAKDNPAAYWNSLIEVYLSCEFNVLETAVAAVGYSFNRYAATEINTSNNDSKTMNGAHLHNFSAGLENIWDNVWIFDAFALRGGLAYGIQVDVASSEDKNNNSKSGTSEPGVHTAVSPVMGLGVSKGFMTLDLSLRVGDRWSGAFSGPPVGLVTGTVKF